MSVEHVSAYQSSDGRLHKTEKEALQHELHLRIHHVFVETHPHYRDIGIAMIIECRKELLEVLTSDPSVALYKFEQ